MRAFALAVLTASGFAALTGVASAADFRVTEGCGRGLVWNGYDCVEAPAPRYAERGYSAPQEYDDDPGYEPAPIYEAPRVYAAPPVYVVRPYYPRPVIRYYAGPRYGGGYRPHRPRYGWRH